MKRRDFLVLVGGAAAWPLEARAQQPEQMRRLGVLMGDANNTHGQALVMAFLHELRNLGWTEGRNLRVDLRWSGGDSDRMQEFAKELVQLHSDVILTRSTPTTAALQRETKTIPIVFLIVSDPVGDGLVASLSRPGGNSTGFVNVEASMGGKWLQLLNEIAPSTKKVALLFNPKTAPGGGLFFSGPFEAATRTVAVEPILAPVHDKAEIEQAINSLGRGGDGGLIVTPDIFLLVHRALIISLAARNTIPAVYPLDDWARDGGLMSYGSDYADIFRRAALIVDSILRGEKPSQLPVQIPTKFQLVLNLKTAKTFGLTVPPSLLALADEVIE